MKSELLLQWNYLIFLIPFALSALMLMLSSFRIGHHRGGGVRHHAPAHHHGHAHSHSHGSAHSHTPSGHSGHSGHHHYGAKVQSNSHTHHTHHHNIPAVKHGHTTHKTGCAETITHSLGFLTALRRAPLMMKLQTFFIGWGLGGFWAHFILLRDPNPVLLKLLPIIAIALGCGFVSAFLLAVMFALVMPKEESFDVSRV